MLPKKSRSLNAPPQEAGPICSQLRGDVRRRDMRGGDYAAPAWTRGYTNR